MNKLPFAPLSDPEPLHLRHPSTTLDIISNDNFTLDNQFLQFLSITIVNKVGNIFVL